MAGVLGTLSREGEGHDERRQQEKRGEVAEKKDKEWNAG